MNKLYMLLAVLFVVSGVRATTIPLVNADFETPASGKIVGFDVIANDIPGWSEVGTNTDSGVEGPNPSWGVHSGSYAAFFMVGDPGAYQMTGYTIQTGEVFTVGFYANNIWTATGLKVTLFGDTAGVPANELGSYTATGLPSSPSYQYYETTIAAPASAAGQELGIAFVNTAGGWVGVDDVTLNVSTNPVSATPTPNATSERPSTEPLVTVDLEGAWSFDPDNGSATNIVVPGGGWKKQGFTCTEADYETSITVTNIGQPQVTRLEFGAVNYQADLYIDEVPVGSSIQSYTPASFDITGYVTPGSNHTIRVHVKGREAFWTGSKYLVPTGAEWSNDLTEGIFRSAELKIYPQVYISDVFVKPSVSSTSLYYDVSIRNESATATNVTLSGSLSSWNGDSWSYPALPPQAISLGAGAETNFTVGPVAWTLGADSYWWPNVPYQQGYRARLHNLNLTLASTGGGTAIHTNSTRFGFRECTQAPDGMGNTCYFLNGIRVNFRGDNLQGSDYDNIVYDGGRSDAYDTFPGFLPPSPGNPGWPQAVDNYQRLNYNVNRIHQQPCTPYMLSVCDEMGLMLIEETAIRGSNGKEDFINGHDNMVNHLVNLYTRDRNHPSIVRQSLSNEPNYESTDSTAFEIDLYNAAMALDGTRPLSIDCGSAYFYESMAYSNFSVYAHYSGGGAFGTYTEAVYPRSDRPYGQGEFIWPADSSKQGLAWFGTATQAMRSQGASDVRPYTLLSAWASVIPGVNKYDMWLEQGGYPVFGEDNLPDPWTNSIIQRVQAGFNPVLVADADYWDAVKGSNANGDWPASVPSLSPSQSVTRTLTIYNDTFDNTDVDVYWDLCVGSPTGTVADTGVVHATVPLGYTHTTNITFSTPYVANGTLLYLVLRSEKDGVELFREEAQRFQFINTDPNAVALSGTAFGAPGSWSDLGNTFEKATDGDTGTYFDYIDSSTNGYTGIDLGAGNESKISHIVYTPRSGFEYRMVGGEFQGSNTGTNAGYTTIYTINTQPSGTTTVFVNTDTAYRYLRYVGPANSYCNIAEMEFYYADPLSSVNVWRLLNFGSTDNVGDAADDADPDGDGVINVIERAHGGNPNVADAQLLPAIDPSAPEFSIVYRKADGASDLASDVQECANLVSNTWSSAIGVNTVISDDGIIQSNRFTAPIDAATKFLRVLITSP